MSMFDELPIAVAQNKMTQEAARDQIAYMRAVLETLRRVKSGAT